MNSIQHIFFDLDNTLWDFNHNSREAIGELYETFSLGDHTQVKREAFVERYLFHNERYWELYRENRVSKSRLRIARFEAVLSEAGIDPKPMARSMCDTYMQECPKKTTLVDGAVEILTSLKPDYELHILSNGFTEAQHMKLRCSGIDHFFNEVITSERASSRKPQSRIYEYAMKLTGALPEASIMIGDHVNIDVVGALSAGWQAVHYNPEGEQHAYTSVAHLSELSGLLGK